MSVQTPGCNTLRTRGKDKPGSDDRSQHDNHESQVDASGDFRQSRFGLDTEGNGGTDEGTHLEDTPEDGERSTLGSFLRVRHHDGSLSCPKKTSG